ncbi:hypothetical protein PENTCL1PPCAC_6805, partial [Pristionchus entomophagus]
RVMFRLVREASRDIVLCTVDSSTTKAKIGRDPKTCTVKLGTKAVAVSREHADLLWTANGVKIVDNSSFGTFIDGVKVIKNSKLLKGGERLKIGQEEFILQKIEEVNKAAQSSELARNKPASKNSIASYFTKKDNGLPEEPQSAEVSISKILETPSDNQRSRKVASQVQSKPVRGGRKRVNPLLNLDDDDDDGVSNNMIGRVLAVETPSDSVPSPKETTPVAPVATQPTIIPATSVTQVNTTRTKKKKVSLFAKPSQRVRTHKPMGLEDDDIVELDKSDPPSYGGPTSSMDDGFVRPSIPRARARATPTQRMAGPSSRIGTMNRRDDNGSMDNSDDMMGMNASSIATQIVPPVHKTIVLTEKNAGGMVSGPPRKKVKSSLFAESERRKKMMQNNQPREKSLLDEDDNGVLNIRYDYVEPKEVIGERAYSCIENVRIMDQAAKEAKARLDKKYAHNDSESQYATAEELTSILCSSYTEEQRKEREEEEKDEEVERVGDETLDEEIKSQMVKLCDSLVVSQPLNHSMVSVNPSQAKGFKKFKKAKQGRFASQSAVFSGIIGGSDLVDFRQIHM